MSLPPKISVIIPIYNVEQHLKRMIESVLVQDFQEFELICVDDGSTDSSGEICDNFVYQDPRVKVIHQTNSGVSIARNKGLNLVKSKYFIVLDSDDYLESNALSLMYNKSERENSDVTMCSVRIQYDNHNHIIKIPQNLSNIQYLQDMLNDNLPIALWNKLIRTDFANRHNIKFINNMNFGEDLVYTTQLFVNNPKISIVDNVLYEYACRNSTNSTATLIKNRKKLDQYFYSLSILTNILDNKNISINEIVDKKKAIAKILAIESGLYKRKEIIAIFNKESKRYIRNNYKLDFAIQLILVKLGFLNLAKSFGKYKRIVKNYLIK